MKPQIFVTRNDFHSGSLDLLRKECDVILWSGPCPITKDDLLRNVNGMNGIFCIPTEKIDLDVIDKAGPNLKVIGTCSVGYDHIVVEECKKRGIRIGHTPDVLTDATAELTVALLLATSRRLVEANREVHNGGWSSWSPSWMCGPSLKNSIVGICGFGRIGQEVARRIVPFKPAEIIYSNRSERKTEATIIGAKYVPFDELLKTSDFIIITVALTPETTHLFNSEAFGKMKSSAILINTARGGIIEQNDLYVALKENRIRAAGLDVTTPEPLPLDDPLLTLPNCVILPHIGSADVNTRIEMTKNTCVNILAGLNGTKMIAEL